MSDTKPSINVLLTDIMQEFMPRGRGPKAYDDWGSANGWPQDHWPNDHHNVWYHNENRVSPTPQGDDVRKMLLRKEAFGGIAYSMSTRRVYSFNDSGYEIARKLQEGETPAQLVASGLSQQTMDEFVDSLKALNITLG